MKVITGTSRPVVPTWHGIAASLPLPSLHLHYSTPSLVAPPCCRRRRHAQAQGRRRACACAPTHTTPTSTSGPPSREDRPPRGTWEPGNLRASPTSPPAGHSKGLVCTPRPGGKKIAATMALHGTVHHPPPHHHHAGHAPPRPSVFPLLHLPRELRDQVGAHPPASPVANLQ